MTSQSFQIAAQLAAMGQAPKDYADSVANAVDAKTDFTIIYPNGGSEGAPAAIAANTRYVMANPFPNEGGQPVKVRCELQTLIAGVWANEGFSYTNSGGSGATASQISTGEIVVQVGYTGFQISSTNVGDGHGNTSSYGASRTARVLVWKVKGAVA
ncbi:hypothetical protein TH9_12175 [Thalassospira xiamenensis]|uniref:hypothetical protein n=1 Tax=Thalassospira xiamenensis TaxID=220697 RepID=UPI000DED526F|nr:hypothetical protein [Thalassospira xiamenensis]RCK32485.1 hypothetical protein TH9_12175 [Thalassospira xiamenensis]